MCSPQPRAKQERGSQPTLQLRLASKEGRRFSRSSYALQNDALDASLFTFAGIAQGDARIYHECKAGKQGRIFEQGEDDALCIAFARIIWHT